LFKIIKKKHIKVAVLGGTFDPPHKGHLHISKVAIRKLKLDKLIWSITKKNPFKKKPHLHVSKRIKLSKQLTIKEKKIYVKYLDAIVKSNSTLDILSYIKKNNRKTKLYFIIGADNLVNFHKWKNWKNIPKIAKIIIFPRKNYSTNIKNFISLRKLSKKDWLIIKTKKINISSSIIRKYW
jgi:nicotinate-nucleotide adenylyltransferase